MCLMNPTQNAESLPQEQEQTQGEPQGAIDPTGEPDWDTRPDLEEEEDRLELNSHWGHGLADGGRALRLRLWREGGVF